MGQKQLLPPPSPQKRQPSPEKGRGILARLCVSHLKVGGGLDSLPIILLTRALGSFFPGLFPAQAEASHSLPHPS